MREIVLGDNCACEHCGEHYRRGVVAGRFSARRTIETGPSMPTEAQWNDYSRDGYLHLGPVLTESEVNVLCQRADDLALGRIVNTNVQMQLDTGGIYEDLPAAVAAFDQATTAYRKIQGLEADEHFVALLRHPVFREVCVASTARTARSRSSAPW